MRYLIFVDDGNEQQKMYEGPVNELDCRYLANVVAPTLRPLKAEEYEQSFAAILHTFARFSYILSGEDVYWCVEWSPGLIVVRFSPNGAMAWSALRSPVPEFGGRVPLQTDVESYDEDAENHQYNLVFSAWDAQFDEKYREWGKFLPASQEAIIAHGAALGIVNSLGEQLKKKYSNSFQEWAKECRNNIDRLAGEGLRLNSAT